MAKRLFLVLLGMVPVFAGAQSFYSIKRPRNVSVSAGSGIANYFGELVNPGKLGQVRYNLVVGAEYYLLNNLSVRAEATWFRISGSDANANDDRVERNLSFFSNCQELSLGATYYILPEKNPYYQRRIVNPYVFAGVGMLHFNPKAEYEGKNYALRPLLTENVEYNRLQVVVPYGMGVRLMVTPLLNVKIEGGYRTTFTDYLDDISSKRYVDPTLLKSDLSRALADRRRELDPDYPVGPNFGVRGNPKFNDGYFLMNVKMEYYIPVELFGGSRYNKVYRKKRKAFNPSHRR
jgi:hypothetical protein